MKTLKEKLEVYNRQKEQAYQIYLKSIGAIEILEELLKESEEKEVVF